MEVGSGGIGWMAADGCRAFDGCRWMFEMHRPYDLTLCCRLLLNTDHQKYCPGDFMAACMTKHVYAVANYFNRWTKTHVWDVVWG